METENKDNDQYSDLIVKSNDLVEAMSRLSLQQLRFLAFISANIPKKTKLEHFKMEVSVSDFMQKFNVKTHAYEQIESCVTAMQQKIVEFKKGKSRIKLNFFIKSEYIDNEGRIFVEIHKDMLPHLTDLHARYTNYRIKDVYQFKSSHTWRMYELLAQYRKAGKRELYEEDVRFSLNLEDKYTRVTDLKNWIIKPAVQEINKLSDLYVEWKVWKKGRKVVGFIFDIHKKDRHESSGSSGQVIDLKPQKSGKKIEKPLSLSNFGNLGLGNLDIYPDKYIGNMTIDEQKNAIHTALARVGVHSGRINQIVEAVISKELDYKIVVVQKIDYLIGRFNNLKSKKTTLAGYIASALCSEFSIQKKG